LPIAFRFGFFMDLIDPQLIITNALTELAFFDRIACYAPRWEADMYSARCAKDIPVRAIA